MNPEQRKLLLELKTTSYGRALKLHLEEQVKKIGDVANCTGLDDMIGRQHALKLIKEIFAFLEEKKTKTKSKNPYI